MESDDDLIFSPPAEESRSPIDWKKFKRLKKAPRASEARIPEAPAAADSIIAAARAGPVEERPVVSSSTPIFETLNGPGSPRQSGCFSGGQELDKEMGSVVIGSVARNVDVENERGVLVDGGCSPEAMDPEAEKEMRASDGSPRVREGGGRVGRTELAEPLGNLELESTQKIDNLNGEEAKGKKKRKKNRVKGVDDDAQQPVSERSKRKSEKERRSYLDMIHAESQRLLRETRDASFRPAPVVQKPISSVLEKIRRRKQEVFKKSSISDSSDHLLNSQASLDNLAHCSEPLSVQCDLRVEDRGIKSNSSENSCHVGRADSCEISGRVLHDSSSVSYKSASAKKCESQPPKTVNFEASQQQLPSQRQSCDSEDTELEDDTSNSCENDDFTPSVLAENLKFEPMSSEDDSSEEEDNDKENLDPHPGGDPVKAFVDDEAEEEDDSDNDPMATAGSEDEEQRGNDEHEDLKDLIASGYEEKDIDTEMRDALHRKWLKQQDAADTENILQGLQCGWRRREDNTVSYEEEHEPSDVETQDEVLDDTQPIRGSRKSSRELKQMISRMFTDAEDPFLSDEEDMEMRLASQLHHERSAEASFLSPVEDESSREVYGLIKKMNIAPQNKRRAKTSSFLDTLVKGCDSSTASKSSFLGRSRNSSLPIRKQGISTARSFIFGRDDSNSRSRISISDVSSEPDLKAKQPKKNVSAKFSSSQPKASGSDTKQETKASSGPSLFEILRASSIKSSHGVYREKESSSGTFEQHIGLHFKAFKSSKKLKVER